MNLNTFVPSGCTLIGASSKSVGPGAIDIVAAGPQGAIHTSDRATIDALLARRYIVIEARTSLRRT